MFGYHQQHSYVYFMAGAVAGQSLIKIGYSWNPHLRSKQIRRDIGSAVEVLHSIKCVDEYEARENERFLHDHFHKNRVVGEWFEPTSELLHFIDVRRIWDA